MKYKIIDNFLPQDTFDSIKRTILGPSFPWCYNSFSASSEEDRIKYQYYQQFTHYFYRDHTNFSDWFTLLEPLFLKLNTSALFRIKANLYTATNRLIIPDYHTDFEYFSGKIAVFYVNTNDGFTLFKDGIKIESIENRLLVFDPDMAHTGTTCTDCHVRCVINIMFYQWNNSTL